MSNETQSPRGSLNGNDLFKLLRDAAIVGAAVAVARVIELLPGLDLGEYDDVITPILIILLTAVRRFLAGPAK